jgi:uncharacterized protein
MSEIRVLNVPGLWDSGPEHWHSRWEAADPTIRRVHLGEWDAPECREWVRALDDAVRAAGPGVVLAAHSLGCATVAHWAELPGRCVRGALLVAPADVEEPGFPLECRGFAPMPKIPLPFPTILVASTDDEWVDLERAKEFAEAWGSRLVTVGAHGHLNSASGLGDWPEGRALLEELLGHPEPDIDSIPAAEPEPQGDAHPAPEPGAGPKADTDPA